METLSRDTLFQLLLNLSGSDLLNICAINRTLSLFCDESNDFLWKTKALQDYQNIPNKPDNISWKRYYILLGTTNRFIKEVLVTYRTETQETIGTIWINNTDTPSNIINSANKLFISKYPNDDPIYLFFIGKEFNIDVTDPISNPIFIDDQNIYQFDSIIELRYLRRSSIWVRLQ